mgnify:CR=1 FL=1
MKGYIIIASLFAALAILFGAFGSHALKERLSAQSLEVYDIATRYLMFHALGIFLIALLGFQLPKESLEIPVIMMIVGTIHSITDNNGQIQDALDCIDDETNHQRIQIHSYYNDICDPRSVLIAF